MKSKSITAHAQLGHSHQERRGEQGYGGLVGASCSGSLSTSESEEDGPW
jgi:hypothetical protein